jgi:hypothetical protein
MTGGLKPLGIGYLRQYCRMRPAELGRARDRLTRVAAAEGLTLKAIFVERPETEPAAFHAVVEAARSDEVSAVIVPTLQHLKPRPGERSRRDRLVRDAGVRVLVVASPP